MASHLSTESENNQLVIITQTAAITGASSRYRCFQYIPFLEKAGFTPILLATIQEHEDVLYEKMAATRGIAQLFWKGTYVFAVTKNIVRILWVITRKTHRDTPVLLQRELMPFTIYPWGEYIISRLLKRPLVFDIDDAVYIANPHVYKIFRWSTHIIAGNEFLAREARQYTPHVTVIPTVIDAARYRPGGRVLDKTSVVIGWIGSLSTTRYLENLRPILIKLMKEFPQLSVMTIGAAPLDWNDIPLQQIPWRLESEIHDLAAIDIGIMPLGNDAFSEGKCSCKLLQYMALGIPTVAAATESNTAIIKDGANGFIAVNEDQWHQKLARLIDDANLRQTLGERAQATAHRTYTVQVQAPRLIALLTSLSVKKAAADHSE